jgi:hypothetical protein
MGHYYPTAIYTTFESPWKPRLLASAKVLSVGRIVTKAEIVAKEEAMEEQTS